MLIKIPVNTVSFLKDMYTASVNVIDLPHNISLASNVREQNLNTRIFKDILDSLKTDEDGGLFYKRNGGIHITAKTAIMEDGNLIIEIPDDDANYGICDGGHTAKAIWKIQELRKDCPSIVTIKISVNSEEEIDGIRKGNNQHNPPKYSDFMNAEGKFDWVYETLANNKYNHINSLIKRKEIKIETVLKCIFGISPDVFNAETGLSIGRLGRGEMKRLESYLIAQTNAGVGRIKPLVIDSLLCYDYIREKFPRWTKQIGHKDIFLSEFVKNFCYDKTIVSRQKPSLIFSCEAGTEPLPLPHYVPDQWVIVMLQALRANVMMNKRTGKYCWKNPPKKVLDAAAPEMIDKINELLKNNIKRGAENPIVHEACYDIVNRIVNRK